MSLTGGWPPLCAPDANPHLYVHNVPKDSNEDELRSVFGQYGTVANVRLKVNQKVGPHAVYAFVTFNSTEEARNALVHLQGKELRGRSLRIEFQRAATTATSVSQHTAAQSPPPPTRLSVVRPTAPHVNAALDPPAKRNRLLLEQSHAVRYVASDDQSGLIDALSQMIASQRPDLLDSFSQFCEHWTAGSPHNFDGHLASSGQEVMCYVQPPEAKAPGFSPEHTRVWPASPLSSLQQRLASEGNLALDQETGRWAVLLSKLLIRNGAPCEQDDEHRPTGYPAGTRRRSTTDQQHFIDSLHQFASSVSTNSPPIHSMQPLEQLQPLRLPLAFQPTHFHPMAFQQQAAPESPPEQSAATAQSSVSPAHTHLLELWTEKISQLAPQPQSHGYVWKGFMDRNEKRVLPVALKMLLGELPAVLLVPTTTALSITLRSPYEEMLKKGFVGVGLLELQNPETDAPQLRDYTAYFNTKDRAGVAKLIENTYAYIFPTSAFPTQNVPAATHALLVVFAKSNE